MQNKLQPRSIAHSGMTRKSLKSLAVALLCTMILLSDVGEGARGGGGGRRGGGRKGTKYGMRMPILIRPRNQEAGNYYEHKDGARIIKSSHFELDYMLGRKITFFCMAKGLPRPEITWFKDGIELYAHKFFQDWMNNVALTKLYNEVTKFKNNRPEENQIIFTSRSVENNESRKKQKRNKD